MELLEPPGAQPPERLVPLGIMEPSRNPRPSRQYGTEGFKVPHYAECFLLTGHNDKDSNAEGWRGRGRGRAGNPPGQAPGAEHVL